MCIFQCKILKVIVMHEHYELRRFRNPSFGLATRSQILYMNKLHKRGAYDVLYRITSD